ncbi:unnamed protein product [Prunus armeniaca]|uniref:Uncharacterized protein n=1 Tax=Prunus armeniaca TaxID=36596 RepID=A0A6J5VQP0_PRUAR|nr:unnamed protein product [Prunus armeniaca]
MPIGKGWVSAIGVHNLYIGCRSSSWNSWRKFSGALRSFFTTLAIRQGVGERFVRTTSVVWGSGPSAEIGF